MPTFDELLGRDGIDEHNIAEAVFRRSAGAAAAGVQVFTLHAELEGGQLLGAFEALLTKWRDAGLAPTCMATAHAAALRHPPPAQRVVMGEIPGRSGHLALQDAGLAPA